MIISTIAAASLALLGGFLSAPVLIDEYLVQGRLPHDRAHAFLRYGTVRLPAWFEKRRLDPAGQAMAARLTQALLDAGLSEAQIRRVAGGNVRDFLLRNLPDDDA